MKFWNHQRRLRLYCLLGNLSWLLAACGNNPPVPVVDRSSAVTPAPTSSAGVASAAVTSTAGMYVVKKGDTLYSIALDHGQDYRDIAAWNNLNNPNLIKVGQGLRVTPPEGSVPVAVTQPVVAAGAIDVKSIAGAGASGAAAAPTDVTNTDTLKRGPKGGTLPYSEAALASARQEAETPIAVAPAPSVQPAPTPAPAEKSATVATTPTPAAAGEIRWQWPTGGKLLTPFGEGGNKGIDLAGKTGEPVQAAADGVVSYAGSGLRGYGNLVVIRHDATWLSVYAHNSKILVKEKQTVKQGQKIAEIGASDTTSPRLHFEIRRQGKPVDPRELLPAQ
jgi:lipoprotein NlpD